MTKPTITSLPTAPDRSVSSTFPGLIDPWLEALEDVPSEVNALTGYSENQAETYSDVTWWVSGGSYSQYDVVFDPSNGGTYRAKATHSGIATAPSADSTNWESAGGVPEFSQAKLDLLSVTSAVDLDQLRTTKTYTANGAITAGETVVLESGGTVALVSSSVGSTTYGTEEQVTAVGTSYTQQKDFAPIGGGKVVVGYIDAAVDNKVVKAVVGEYSGGSWSWGTPQTLATEVYNCDAVRVVYESTSDTVVIGYEDGLTVFHVTAATISGTVLTFGTTVALEAGTADNDFIMVAGGGVIFLAYEDGSALDTRLLSVSGTTITAGTIETISTGAAPVEQSISVNYHPDNDVFIVGQTNNSFSNYLHEVRLLSYSGTTLTEGATYQVSSAGNTQNNPAIYCPMGAGKILCMFQDNTVDGDPTLVVLSFSGITISGAGTEVVIDDTVNWDFVQASRPHYLNLTQVSATKAMLGIQDAANNNYGTILTISVDGTTPSVDETSVVKSNNATYMLGLRYVEADNELYVGYETSSGNNLFLRVVSPFPVTTDADDWIGIAKNTVADGEEVDLATPGDLVTGLSGLTINADCYVGDDGSITSTANSRRLGIALSATTALITEGNAA